MNRRHAGRALGSTTSLAASGAPTAEPLRGRPLVLARIGWLIIAAFALSLFVAGIPSEYATLETVCKTGCTYGQLSPDGFDALRDLDLSLHLYAAYGVTLDVSFAAVYVGIALLVFWRRPDDRMALFISLALLTFGTATFPSTINALAFEHAAWSWPASLLHFLGSASFGLFLYVFPDGRFVPRWTRWVALVWIAWQLPKYWFPGSDSLDPEAWSSWLALGVWAVALGTVVYSQAYRYRHVSNAAQRQQVKWVVFGVSVALLVFLGTNVAMIAVAPASLSAGTLAMLFAGAALTHTALILIPLSIGIAILRYRLFDIDFIINRTIVYAALTAGVIGVYVLVVGSVGAVLRVQGNVLVSILAAGLVAVLFQPVRERLQRAVNHLMYGKRDDPYAVLSHLGQRLESTLAPDEVLPAVTRTVREALKLPYAEIQLRRREGFENAAAAGDPVDDTLRLPLVYGGETVGLLVLGLRVRRGKLLARGRAPFRGPGAPDRRCGARYPPWRRGDTPLRRPPALARTAGKRARGRAAQAQARPPRRARSATCQPDDDGRGGA